ncbi:hypothetical protein LZZ98_02635 [Acinetobacter sp. SM34]|nr:hypothetical protein [Acinetobacter sp. SM34]MCG2607460.1 hypothetical protein [Acinetobacter sp. SM34]
MENRVNKNKRLKFDNSDKIIKMNGLAPAFGQFFYRWGNTDVGLFLQG